MGVNQLLINNSYSVPKRINFIDIGINKEKLDSNEI